MSRAFTKEDDAGDDLPERPVPPGPNYVTPRGFQMLKDAADGLLVQRKQLQAGGGDLGPVERDLRYYDARISAAIVVPPGSGEEIRFGAQVEIESGSGERRAFQIVGEDEARTDAAFMPWSAPLARAMMGKKPGETFDWQAPQERIRYRVVSVKYSKGS